MGNLIACIELPIMKCRHIETQMCYRHIYLHSYRHLLRTLLVVHKSAAMYTTIKL